MPKPKVDPFDDKHAHLQHLPDQILQSVATNGAAQRDYRKHAVELLIIRKSPLVKHPELKEFVDELEVELDAIDFSKPQSSGALTSSITTETMFSDGPVVPKFTGFTLPDLPKSTRKKPNAS